MKNIFAALLILLFSFQAFTQTNINLENIDIVRDEFGVPHIFTQTDLEATYGIGWAQCEDNFHLMQKNFGMVKNLSGRLVGKNGAVVDYLYQMFEIDKFVERRYQQDVSSEFEAFLITYASSINKYAETHPEEVLMKELFPVTPKQILGNHVLHMMLMHSSAMELGKFLTKDYAYDIVDKSEHGSNAMAYSPNKTVDGKSYLIGNPHQPVNEMGNWWEASIHSEEGYEIYGASFSVGGLFPTIGSNRNLGWTHTTNYHHSSDVYLLEMHPKEKYLYQYDGEWIPLEVKKAKLKVKIAGIVIPVSKKYYTSKFGPTFEKDGSFYSFKNEAYHNLRAPEQWYKMGKAKNFKEFEEAISIQGVANQTITYADFEGNIYHLSAFNHPYRDDSIDWSETINGNTTILPGNTSKYNWSFDEVHPIEDLPHIKNPKSGYLYNCNNTVFKMTAPEENLKPEDFPNYFGLLRSNSTRANTFENLITNYDKISFEEARKIRESVWVDKHKLSLRNCMNCDEIPNILSANADLKDAKAVFDKWDGNFNIENEQASFMMLTTMYIEKYIISKFGNEEKDLPKEELELAIFKAKKFLMKHYGKLEVPLGDIQKAKRFDTELPMYGCINTLANCHVKEYGKGKVEIAGGDSYIFYAKYGKNGLETYESINAFGNSLKEGHPHSTDQTEMYTKMKTRPALLDLKKLKAVGKVYHPK